MSKLAKRLSVEDKKNIVKAFTNGDDITRLYNFLIYLTDIPKKNGGSLTI